MIHIFLTGLAIMLAGGSAALLLRERYSAIAGAAGSLLGAIVACVPAFGVLTGMPSIELRLPWNVPMGSFSIALDPLSAFFALPILIVPAIAAIYGTRYLSPKTGRRRLGACWFAYNLLTASMAIVVVARNGMLFLFAWEIMTLASWVLVTLDDEKRAVRHAGWTYLVASHIGVAFLFMFFALLARHSGTMDFDQLASGVSGRSSLLFLLALAGFGTKAGFMPLHVWLPEAHPAAPSHVSAVMSGVMIKTGIYGILRTLLLLGEFEAWWGYLLVGIGVASGVLGVLFALAQHDLKRLLAYSSVENIGIIGFALGLGVLGTASNQPVVAALGFGCGLLHVVNHAAFKSLLFLCAGAVQHGAHTLEIDRLGGLLRRMPWTGTCFLIGAIAICGLPPLNGFASELLGYIAALDSVANSSGSPMVAGALIIAALALIGGIAVACFAKAFGMIFLGEPRQEQTARSHECAPAMYLPMAALAIICLLLGIATPAAMAILKPVVASLMNVPVAAVADHFREPVAVQITVSAIAFGLLWLGIAVAFYRRSLLRRRGVRLALTWDCGYSSPTARLQYTGSSFAEPMTTLAGPILQTHIKSSLPQGVLPESGSVVTHTPEIFTERLFRPLFATVTWMLARLRWLQHGRLHYYVLYMALTLLALLIWQLGGSR